MNKFNKIFEELAKVNDRSIIWSNWLDYCIAINLLNPIKQEINFNGNEEEYFEMFSEWVQQLEKDLQEQPYSDRLGLFYEELVTSHVKSKNLGQFYTPDDVTRVMTKICLNNPLDGFVNDCACGSARMLLSAYVENEGRCICIGQDLDEISCKMAVLNFYSHGVRGSIIHQNTLEGDYYGAWRVNNYLGYGTLIPHIELVTEREAYQFIGQKTIDKHEIYEINPKKGKDIQSTLI